MFSKVISVYLTMTKLFLTANIAEMARQSFFETTASVYNPPNMPACAQPEEVTLGIVDHDFQLDHPFVDGDRLVKFTGNNSMCTNDTYGCETTLRRGILQKSNGLPIHDHGTQLLAILTSSTNPNIKVGLVKLGPENNMKGAVDKYFAQAIRYATQRHFQILVYPWCTQPDDKNLLRHQWSETIKAMKQFPGLIVASSGNWGINVDKDAVFPASFTDEIPNLLAVAQVNKDNDLDKVSNYGKSVQFAIYAQPKYFIIPCNLPPSLNFFAKAYCKKTTVVPFDYFSTPRSYSTSGAAAYLGRLLAEIKSLDPTLSNKQIIEIVHKMSSPVTRSQRVLKQIRAINVEETLQEVAKNSKTCMDSEEESQSLSM